MHRFCKWSVSGVALLVVNATQAQAQQPDPVALLRGVEQARHNLAGSLQFEATSRMPNNMVPTVRCGTIQFDGVKRQFRYRQDILMIDPPDEDRKVAEWQALKGDLKASERAKLGKVHNVYMRLVYDGNQLAECAHPDISTRIIAPEKGGGEYCFDVRTLGLSRSHDYTTELTKALGLNSNTDGVPSLVGSEMMAGREVWHVKVEYPSGFANHFWIENSDSFLVRRFEYHYSSGQFQTQVIVKSEYGDRTNLTPLPVRVEVTETQNDKFRFSDEIRITKSDFTHRPDPAVFGLAGLEIPLGGEVSDDRIMQTIGYWNGTGLSESPREAMQTVVAELRASVDPPTPAWVWVAAAGALAMLAGVLLWRWRAYQRGA